MLVHFIRYLPEVSEAELQAMARKSSAPVTNAIHMEFTAMRRFLVATIAAVMLMAWSPALGAHPGHEQKVLGTVTMVAPDHVMLKTPDGRDATVQINNDTKFVRAKKAVTASDMKVGMRIVITAVTDGDDDKLIAKIVELGQAPATK
ncbi:MAG: hypothetical protein A3J29_07600 [Acidobacteria bacterium RIFCSPLOWO2_12_FULL_67_14b]|nr:MAG: hypothetical protein A3J29_07600 [Acidobacteria bacterium RIFCSPLOWO2_12_FULL_67_14b]